MSNSKPRFDGEWVRVSDAFDLRMGKTPSRKNPSYWREGNHDWASIADLGSSGKYVGQTKERINDLAVAESGIKPAPANTVLMSFKLSLGKTSITTSPIYTNEAIMAFVDKGVYPVDQNFMYHQCRVKDWTASTNTAVMGKTLNKKTLGQALIYLPSLMNQRAIAEKLDFIESRIANANQQFTQLDALVKSQFVAMFGDPGDNPMKWPIKSLTSLGECRNGLNFRSEDSGYEIPCLGVSDFQERSVINDMSLLNTITVNSEPASNHLLKNGDIVFVRSNGNKELVGRCLAIYPGESKVTFSGFCIRLRVTTPQVRIPFLVWALKHPSLRRQMLGQGANVQNLSQKKLDEIRVPIPPLGTQDEFLDFAAQVDKSRLIAQQQIEKLQMLYDSLAQEYFS